MASAGSCAPNLTVAVLGYHTLFKPSFNGEASYEDILIARDHPTDVMGNFYQVQMYESVSILTGYSSMTVLLMAAELKINPSERIGNNLLTYSDDQINSAYDRVNSIPLTSFLKPNAVALMSTLMPPYSVNSITGQVIQARPSIYFIRESLLNVLNPVVILQQP